MATINEIKVLGRSNRPEYIKGLRIEFRGVEYLYEPWKQLVVGGLPDYGPIDSWEFIESDSRSATRTDGIRPDEPASRDLSGDEAELYDLAFVGNPPPLNRLEWLSHTPGTDAYAVIPGDREALDILRASGLCDGRPTDLEAFHTSS